jgi:hypothetical protein
MRFIQEYGYSVKVGQEEAHQKWLTANEEKFAASHPQGAKYLGTFGMVYSSEKTAGFYKTYIELDSYAALDTLAAAAKDKKSAFARMLREVTEFSDLAWDAPWSSSLFKAVVDSTIWDPKG